MKDIKIDDNVSKANDTMLTIMNGLFINISNELLAKVSKDKEGES